MIPTNARLHFRQGAQKTGSDADLLTLDNRRAGTTLLQCGNATASRYSSPSLGVSSLDLGRSPERPFFCARHGCDCARGPTADGWWISTAGLMQRMPDLPPQGRVSGTRQVVRQYNQNPSFQCLIRVLLSPQGRRNSAPGRRNPFL